MRGIITVIGADQKGIIAKVCTCLYEKEVNVLDITQTLLQEYFTMVMLVDLTDCACSFETLQEALDRIGSSMGLSIRVQREEIFHDRIHCLLLTRVCSRLLHIHRVVHAERKERRKTSGYRKYPEIRLSEVFDPQE